MAIRKEVKVRVDTTFVILTDINPSEEVPDFSNELAEALEGLTIRDGILYRGRDKKMHRRGSAIIDTVEFVWQKEAPSQSVSAG